MKIAFFTNKPYSKCETFIKAQIDNLPFEIVHYWGNNVPFNVSNNPNLIVRILKKAKLIKRDVSAKLCKDIHKHKIEVVVAQYGMLGAKLLMVCEQLSLPLVVHFHGHDAVRKSVLADNKDAYKAMFSYEKLVVISVSLEMTKRLINLGCSKEKIVYCPYGPNPDFVKLELNYSKLQFIGVGRFVEKKAPHLTILAFSTVLKKHPEAKLLLAGTGVLLDSCKDLVEALKIEQSVSFAGQITPVEFQQYMKESLAFVQHSIQAQDDDMEGTPVSILEASGAGLPVIGTFHAGIPDVILNKETGLLCAEKDIAQMAEHMNWVIENKSQAIKMGAQGKKRVKELFSMEKYISNLTEAIISISK